jgi:hypothetical protein
MVLLGRPRNRPKLPIVFAGFLLGDEELGNINKSFPKACFGEDEQTACGDCWTGAKVVFTGHSGIDEVTGIGRDYVRGPNAWGPYEHIPPATWGPGQRTSEGYRHAASYGWVGQALALRLLHAEKAWNHDPFFDYVDRWMYQTDENLRPHDRRCWENFVNEMWVQYRAAPGMPPSDGWKQQHDDSYYRNAVAKQLKSPAQDGG